VTSHSFGVPVGFCLQGGSSKCRGPRCIRITELNAAGFHARQGGSRAFADQSPLFFCNSRIDVEQKGINVGAELGNDEADFFRHQPADKSNVARQTVKLGNDNRAAALPSFRESRPQFRAPVESIVTFPGLGLDKPHIAVFKTYEFEIFSFRK
jgi:hypothetical protein